MWKYSFQNIVEFSSLNNSWLELSILSITLSNITDFEGRFVSVEIVSSCQSHQICVFITVMLIGL